MLTEEPSFISSPRQTLSAKRMRPPLAEISTVIASSSAHPTPAATTATMVTHSTNSYNTPWATSSQPSLSLPSHDHYASSKQNYESSKSIIYSNGSIKSNNHDNHNSIANEGEMHMHDQKYFISSGPLPLSLSAARPLSSDEPQHQHRATPRQQQQQHKRHQQQLHRFPDQSDDRDHTTAHVSLATAASSSTSKPISHQEPRRRSSKHAMSRSQLSRDAKVLKTRIRKLWMDPRQPEHYRSRHDPKNQYILLEESLAGILQIVPPIIQNANASKPGLGLTRPAIFAEPMSSYLPAPTPALSPSPESLAVSATAVESSMSTVTDLPSSPAPWNPVGPPGMFPLAASSNAHSKSSGSMPSTPIHTRTRTTSSNSASTISATRFQIATNILQPPEPSLTDMAQPTVRSPTNGTLLGELALSSIAVSAVTTTAAAAGSSHPLVMLDTMASQEPTLEESNEMLIKNLLKLTSRFTGAVRTLCEQQNEKVLRFDDDTILELLTQWEQEAGKAEQQGTPDNASSTSLVTLGATTALERYQIMVTRVWEETEVILSSVRKVRDLVEFGRVQHYSDFDDDDSEEDAVERDEEVKRNLYPTLLFHANGLVTVLGEFLECVSGILRLVGTIKTQRKSFEGDRDDMNLVHGSLLSGHTRHPSSDPPSINEFMPEEPMPVRYLDPALMRRLKPKTPLKSFADKVRRSFTDLAHRSSGSIRKIFPPLGDGNNEGFNSDSFTDGEYESEGYVPSEMGSSLYGDDDAYIRALSPPESPSFMSSFDNQSKHQQRHRRLSSKDSAAMPKQYWPGSMKLDMSDDSLSALSPTSNPVSPTSMVAPSGFVFGGTQMAMLRSVSSERTTDTISGRFRVASGPGTPPVPKKSLESLRETAEPTSYFSYEPEPQVTNPLPHAKPEVKDKRYSMLMTRRNSQTAAFTGTSISAPIPIVSRSSSMYSTTSEAHTPSRHNYKARPPKPPMALPPVPPLPAQSSSKADEMVLKNTSGQQQKPNDRQLQMISNNRTNSYLATRSTSPQQMVPPTLESAFTRQTSIRMVNDRNRYSVKMPADVVSEPEYERSASASTVGAGPNSHSLQSVFWRRRSYNDALEKSWQVLQYESFYTSPSHRPYSGTSDISTQSIPVTSEFFALSSLPSPSWAASSGGAADQRRLSVHMTSFEFLIPFFSKDKTGTSSPTAITAALGSSMSGSRLSSGTLSSRNLSSGDRHGILHSRRHSSPLTTGAEKALADALGRRTSVSLQQNQWSSSQALSSGATGGSISTTPQSTNRNSVDMMPTVDEHSNQQQQQQQHRRQISQQNQQQRIAPRPARSTDQLPMMGEAEYLAIRPRPRLHQKGSSHDASMISNHGKVVEHQQRYQQNLQYQQNQHQHQQYHQTRDSREQSQPSQQYQHQHLPLIQGYSHQQQSPISHQDSCQVQHLPQHYQREQKSVETNEGRHGGELTRRPVSGSRLGDMRKAWDIMNLDPKRMNPYSSLRAYARGITGQNNLWALSHPNALQSATSPRVLHICENGVDVLVLEMSAGYLQVVAGLLEKLIERLADQNEQDSEYISCFLLSHSFFIDSEDLLDRLMARFHIQPRQGEMLYFEKWQMVIQIKWIQVQYEDFELNPNLLKTLKQFLEIDVRKSGFVKEAGYIEEEISKRSLAPKKNCSVIMEQGRFCLQRSRTRKISLSKSQNRSAPPSAGGTLHHLDPVPPSPTEQLIEYGPMPELSSTSPILQLTTLELARYLTLADMKAFRSITVFELMSGLWKRRQAAENKKLNADEAGTAAGAEEHHHSKAVSGMNVIDMDSVEDGAIEAFTRRANMLSYWVAHEILSVAGTKTRKKLIKKFIEVAKICRSLNNLHTCMFIVSALISTPVRRLTMTWKIIKSREMKALHQLEQLLDISGNMRHYRQALEEVEAPAIPFLPILLKDITFILDGNPTMITSRINAPSSGQIPLVSGGSSSSTQAPILSAAGATAGTAFNPEDSVDLNLNHINTNDENSNNQPNVNQGQLVNFDKFRQLTQYVEDAVDMAKSADYWFEPQLLRQARVFRPTSPVGDRYETDSMHGSVQSGRGGNNNTYSPLDSSCGALDHISEIVERRLVKASGLYGVHQRVIEVEFTTKPRSNSHGHGGGNSLWKGGVAGVGGIQGLVNGHGHGGSNGSVHGSGHMAETVIRAVQGEEEYLMGLSLMCEPGR
ncbi:hypothetical protein EDD11_009948 [Mortierella claussenii]|nr:hypothetical protein EDD11_009948 [Mortierella claussenii]